MGKSNQKNKKKNLYKDSKIITKKIVEKHIKYIKETAGTAKYIISWRENYVNYSGNVRISSKRKS